MIDPRENEVVQGALDLPGAETRAAFLAEACEGDDHLRARIEARIRERIAQGPPSQGGEPPKTNSPAVGPQGTVPLASLAHTDLPTERPGDTIGRYQLLEQIGEGGFGVVYVAEQREPIKRRVAIKVIKLGMDTRQVVARFEAERQALAIMDHPSIAKVHDAGATNTGRPYFVMELVRGIPITRYCDDHQVPIEQRLELFNQVCQAIQHAHHKGVIHRDIKPSNILVTLHDGVPVPKVIDFGIAKATLGGLSDQTIYTQLEQFIGTPAYASPEQAEMAGQDVDTRSDIYSLGVLLYELLTGNPPFDPDSLLKGGLGEMRRIICEVEPPKPSTRLSTLAKADKGTVAQRRQSNPIQLTDALRGDLDWIVMKALEKDRTRRYETADGLAMDIRRFLKSEPVVARPPSTAYLVQKLFRRQRLAFALVGIIALTLVAGIVISCRFAIEAAQAEKAAIAERSKALDDRDRSIKAERLARTERNKAQKAEAEARREREEAVAKAEALQRELLEIRKQNK